MKKSFYSTFGTSQDGAELAATLARLLDVELVLHESSYLGEYFKYSGLFADKLTIENNHDPSGEPRYAQFKEHPTLIFLSNENGKNAEKLSKHAYLKTQLRQIPGIVLLDDLVHVE
ncbi:hypothetical protein HF313_05100 [Massilia atriviolacea]|uniref:Uncharacterized protein n=1 Tax=Massilia atriviolacea TaxID=2495579 RepID=A0A430HHH2_9BURK|nr:hypothetical protein [Massilia atriviolacea]RSZ56967.1 hypothetical protein EJB06_21815 [Massilia atriviolacea]